MLQSKTDNPLDGLHLETYVRADADGVASCAAGLLAARCAEAVSRRGVFTLALSGGSTPLTLFRLLRTEAWAARVDWAHTRVFWVDERCVTPDHPASNYGAANQELLAHVPAAEIYPMDGEIDPGESAVAYEELLRQHVPAEQGMPRLDCALLGMGDDGHTASLFPGSPLLAPEALRSGRLTGFAVAEHLAPKPESRRITLTLEMINAARCIEVDNELTGFGFTAAAVHVVDVIPAIRMESILKKRQTEQELNLLLRHALFQLTHHFRGYKIALIDIRTVRVQERRRPFGCAVPCPRNRLASAESQAGCCQH